jgi:polyisoprenoid-binding protein YceI
MKRIAILTLAAGLSIPVLGAPDTYVIDGDHSFPKFEYNHFGFSLQQSRFDKTSGKITLDRAAKTGSAEITVDAKSVNTGNPTLNSHLMGDGFFEVEKFPSITYKATRMNFEGDRLVAIDGNLTVKGITRPVTLTVTAFNCMAHPFAKKEACGANATAKIMRSDFNLGKYVPKVGDEVTLTIAVEAIHE